MRCDKVLEPLVLKEERKSWTLLLVCAKPDSSKPSEMGSTVMVGAVMEEAV